MAANSHFGNMGEFDPKIERKAILLTVVGPAAYCLMRNLIVPKTVEEATYAELLEAMKKHHDPQPSEIVQRFKFNTCTRSADQTVSAFVAQLCSIAEFCNFGAELDNMLRDRLVCGIENQAT